MNIFLNYDRRIISKHITDGNNSKSKWGQSLKKSKDEKISKVLSKTWNDFWQQTTISGITNARGTRSVWRRNLWFLIFTIFTILTITSLQSVIKDFISHPVTTFVTVKHHNQVNTLGIYGSIYLTCIKESPITQYLFFAYNI